MMPGCGAGSTRVKEAGSVVVTRAPSPRLRPTAVRVKGRPISAPRGFNSVITGAAAKRAVRSEQGAGQSIVSLCPPRGGGGRFQGNGDELLLHRARGRVVEPHHAVEAAVAVTALSGLKATV